MRKHIQYLLGALFISILASCDAARYPIDSIPAIPVDNRLLGTWKVKGKHEEFTLIKQTDYKYLILYRNRRHDEYDKYPAFLSTVEGVKFLNIYSQDDSASGGYSFIRIIDINVLKNEVIACNVTDSTLKTITDPAGVRELIAKNLTNPAFYSDTTYFFRLK